jgi:hypothetical protein
MNGHSALAYLIQTKVSISQHPPFVTSCYFVYIIMHVPPQPVPRLSVSSIVLLEILTPPYERHGALAYLIQTKFQFLNTLHLLRAVTFMCIIMHVPPQPVRKFEI